MVKRGFFYGFFVWGLFMIMGSPHALGDPLERAIMPGPLTQAHAKFEDTFKKCHAPFAKQGQASLCLSCHKPVKQDLDAGQGFHGRSPHVRDGECTRCHSDHLGRAADITGLDRETFDHGQTDFPLTGAHGETACTACHKAGVAARKAPQRCIACHKADDHHKGQMGENCAQCHSPKNWRASHFDHAKTGFPLKGGHAKAACATCHPGERYKKTPKTCIACHQINDTHAGRFGAKCASCHTEQAWKPVRFEHKRDTGIGLDGKHRSLSCYRCHDKPVRHATLSARKKRAGNCFSCHRLDDTHKGRLSEKCATCHSPEGWKPARFEHNRQTDFSLAGKHAGLACTTCHKEDATKKKLKSACIACHKADDRHAGQLGERCARCHDTESWTGSVRFDHDLARFPLIGLHAGVPCEECHLDSRFKSAPTDCVACHKPQDKHRGALGTACGQCHNPNDWSRWRFDHNSQSDFPLDGRHVGLACADCHSAKGRELPKPGKRCVDCHRADDEHQGAFGNQCERCHVTDSFRAIVLKRKGR